MAAEGKPISELDLAATLLGSNFLMEVVQPGFPVAERNRRVTEALLQAYILGVNVAYFRKDGSQAMEGDIDMNGHKVKQVANATSNDEAPNFGQLQAAIDGRKPKPDVKAASVTSTLVHSGEQTIDGVVLMDSDRFLDKDNTDATIRGIFIIRAGAWERAPDADTGIELQGAEVLVTQGTVNAGTSWYQYAIDIVLGTTDLLWRQNNASVPDATDTTRGKLKLFIDLLNKYTDGAVTQAAIVDSIQASLLDKAVVSGTDTYTCALTPAITGYLKGQTFKLTDVNANTVTNPTININGLGAKNLVNYKNAALNIGDFVGTVIVMYDGTAFRMIGGGGSGAASSIIFTPAGNIAATNVQAAIEELDTKKAAIASPTFTGVPSAPTAAPGTNTTQLANTAFVVAAINALIAAAPGALDTLDELAAALGDDANFASTITTLLALKAPLASPTFTGTPAAPTAPLGTNTTQLATMAAVQQEIANAATIANVGAKLYLFNAY
jgi:hypothetical protein